MLCALAEDKRLIRCRSDQRRDLKNEIKELRRDSAVRKEWGAKSAYLQVEAAERKLGRAPSSARKMQVARSYATVARTFPGTAYGQKAVDAAKRLSGQE